MDDPIQNIFRVFVREVLLIEWPDPTFPSLARYIDPEDLIFLYEDEKILKMQVAVGGFTDRLSYIPIKICKVPVSGSWNFDSRMQHDSVGANERRRGLVIHNAGALSGRWLGLLNIKISIKD